MTRNGTVVGEALQMFLKLPRDVIGTPSPEWCWTGRVLRVTPVGNRFVEIAVSFVAYDQPKEPRDLGVHQAAGQPNTQIYKSEEVPNRLFAETFHSKAKQTERRAATGPRTSTKCIVVP